MSQFDDPISEAHELEARLRSFQPRAPELDIDRVLDGPPATSDSLSVVETSHVHRSWLTVAGAWACGAIVGGVAVFFVMQNRIETLGPTAVESSRETDVVSRLAIELTDGGSPNRNTSPSESMAGPTSEQTLAAAVHAMTLDRPRAYALSYTTGTSALTAGSHLRPFVDRDSTDDGDVMRDPSNRQRNTELELNTGNLQPPVTRAWLLEELRSI